ncbi:MAG: GAF domain-containing protein [Anaerolineae bacterium]|jgi:class 3 adenylate cyclase/GAF domain-containing protein|nr:MAG: GAF domain-containing protein [Anaerolineae bacterium]MCL4877636.1 GAF domain-containing protein [Anaerolineae bacterium]
MVSDNFVFTEEKIQRMSAAVSEAAQQLRAQSNILRQRGMNLPPGTVEGLESIHIALENIGARVAEQYNELTRLRALSETASLINSSLDLDEVLNSAMDTVLQLTRAERGYIMLRNPETGALQFRVARGIEQKDMDSDQFVVSRTIVQRVAETGEAILTTNAQDDDRFAGQKSIVGYNLRSILCVPLIWKEQVLGVVYADNSIMAGLFGNKELMLLTAFASQAAIAIENARLFEQARLALEEITGIKILLDNILASLASGVITTDAQDMITTYNLGAEHILGIPRSATEGQFFNQAVPEIYTAVQEALPRVRAQDEAIIIEADPVLPNRQKVNLNLRLSPLKDAGHTTQGVALVVDDLTEIKKRDAMLNVVRKYLPPAMVDNIRSIDQLGLGGERRYITALFVEVRPFNTFSHDLKAGELMELLNLYLTVGTEAVHRRSGLIDKYMGSEIMGLFNTQLNPSDQHAWDAVQAALDMTVNFQMLYQQMDEKPTVPYYRIGINTGIATLGNVGGTNRREFSAIGDTINLAKRLQESAVRGEIIISQETFDVCRERLANVPLLEVIPRGAIQVKGRLQETNVYQLLLNTSSS